MLGEPRQLLKAMFDAAIGAASPKLRIPAYLPPPPKGRTVVIGAGKASAAMAKAVEDLWPGPLTGLVVTRYGHAVPCERIEIVEASHPVPDENGHQAAKRMLEMVQGLGPDDLVLALISGGGSSLAEPARRWPDLGRQAGGQRRSAPVRRVDRRDEHRAQAPFGDQGRPACGRGLSGPARNSRDLGRARRRSGRHRLRSDRRRQLDLCRSARACWKNTGSPNRVPRSST